MSHELKIPEIHSCPCDACRAMKKEIQTLANKVVDFLVANSEGPGPGIAAALLAISELSARVIEVKSEPGQDIIEMAFGIAQKLSGERLPCPEVNVVLGPKGPPS